MQKSLAVSVDRSLKLKEEVTDEHFYAQGCADPTLPLASCRRQFNALIASHQVILVIGETGSGKSTLVPQFLLDDPAWVGVCVAEPRRLAAVNLADYVATQRGSPLGGPEVGYLIRYEQCLSEDTRLTFTTVGLLLRTFLFDPLLERYQLVMLDEVHERSIETDLALALMKKVVGRRSDFRLILASATPDHKELANFFKDQLTVLHVPGRQYQVSIYHVCDPVPDYIRASYLAIVRIHTQKAHDPGAILCFLPGQAEIAAVHSLLLDYMPMNKGRRLVVLPLYASLPHSKKVEIFRRCPNNSRKVILATSIAETSLTIPDVVFVVDCGFTRIRCRSKNVGQESLMTVPVSWQQADQRAGRAGRLRAGECYRLYPKNSDLLQYSIPEICRVDLTSYLIKILALGVQNLARFDLPSQPASVNVLRALDSLLALGIMDPSTGQLTDPDGLRAAELPLECRYSVLLIKAEEMGCLDEMLDIVSAFQVRDVFTSRMKKLKLFGAKEGDVITVLNAVRAFRNCSQNQAASFCAKNGLNYDALCRAQRVRQQLESSFSFKPSKMSESFTSTDVILRCLVTGLFQNGVMISFKTSQPQAGGEYQPIVGNPENRYHLHRHSVFYGMDPLPEFLVFHTLSEDNIMFEVSIVREINWFSELVPNYYRCGTERELTQ